LLPIIEHILRIKNTIDDHTPNTREPYAVIIAPTGELAMQIANNAQCLVDKLHNVKVCFDRGGLDARKFDQNRQKGCDILVLTPGKTFHYFNTGPEEMRSVSFKD
jgi:superfamily II DNA/RNA helicase